MYVEMLSDQECVVTSPFYSNTNGVEIDKFNIFTIFVSFSLVLYPSKAQLLPILLLGSDPAGVFTPI